MPEDSAKLRGGVVITTIAAVGVVIWAGFDGLGHVIDAVLAVGAAKRFAPEAVKEVGPTVGLVAGTAIAIAVTWYLKTAWTELPHLLQKAWAMVAVGAGVVAIYSGLRLSEHPLPAPVPNAVARDRSNDQHAHSSGPSRSSDRSVGGETGSSRTGQSKQQSASSSVTATSSSGSQGASAQTVHEVAARSPEQHHESAPPAQTYTRPVSQSRPQSHSPEGSAHVAANPSGTSSTVEGDASSGKETGGPEGSGH
jgi:hypothetical protein